MNSCSLTSEMHVLCFPLWLLNQFSSILFQKPWLLWTPTFCLYLQLLQVFCTTCPSPLMHRNFGSLVIVFFILYCQYITTHTHTHTPPQVNLGSMILRYNHSLANTPDSFTLLFLCQYFQGEKKKATTPIKPNCPSLLEELAYISWIVLF